MYDIYAAPSLRSRRWTTPTATRSATSVGHLFSDGVHEHLEDRGCHGQHRGHGDCLLRPPRVRLQVPWWDCHVPLAQERFLPEGSLQSSSSVHVDQLCNHFCRWRTGRHGGHPMTSIHKASTTQPTKHPIEISEQAFNIIQSWLEPGASNCLSEKDSKLFLDINVGVD